jgi:ribosomal-protein-alanine N-acetyltransferase
MNGILRTERLRLEPLMSHHVPAYLAYQIRNRAYLRPWEPDRTDEYYTPESIAHEVARTELDDTCRRFAIFEREGETILGIINLWNIRRGVDQSAGLGYAIDEHHQGRGFATEACRGIIAFAFGELNLHRLQTSYQPHNKASAAVLRKVGFEIIGYAREQLLIDGAWRDGVLVALINSNWKAS